MQGQLLHKQIITSRQTTCKYYYDPEAVRLPPKQPLAAVDAAIPPKRPDKQRGHQRVHEGFRDHWDGLSKAEQQAHGSNLLTVWDMATQAFRAASLGFQDVHHSATFPERLPSICIRAGTSEKGVCGRCGAPWTRVLERNPEYDAWAKRQRAWGRGVYGGAFAGPGTNAPAVPSPNTRRSDGSRPANAKRKHWRL